MCALRLPDPALLIIAAFSRHLEAIDWAREQLQPIFGTITRTSPLYNFDQTRYYEPDMGADLKK